MQDSVEKYGLDMHCSMILEEYRDMCPMFCRMRQVVLDKVNEMLCTYGLYVTAVEARVKTESSLAGKLELKGQKYKTLSDITDILGVRVITFYSTDVDKISSLIEGLFDIDWHNSVDKRKVLDLDKFGYMSLHYVCSIPKSLYVDADYPEVNEFRFEIQMRTALQHVWANMFHDIGYKTHIEIPKEYLRRLSRLAGLLEMADDEFNRIRVEMAGYRRHVQDLVENGSFDEVPLTTDTFARYLQNGPFAKLNEKIAALNSAEIHEENLMFFLRILLKLDFSTLGDLERLKKDCFDDAYRLAVLQIGQTDIDIISSSIGLQNLLIINELRKGTGLVGMECLYALIHGKSKYNAVGARHVMEEALKLNIITEIK